MGERGEMVGWFVGARGPGVALEGVILFGIQDILILDNDTQRE